MVDTEKYSHHFTDLLRALGYTHCFFVPGGNSMHLLDSARTRMTCIPFVHEVSAGIAAEYFNEVSESGRAYCLVTAGPGLTNVVTALGGAYLESRELLVVGGQVKSADLARGGLRQRGIQEIDGLAIAQPVCKATLRIETPLPDADVVRAVSAGATDRRGPVFIEFCLDAQGAPVPVIPVDASGWLEGAPTDARAAAPGAAAAIVGALATAERPVLLIGGGVRFEAAQGLLGPLEALGVPLMTTWNGADRIPDDHPLFAGRPNTWGQRAANILLSEADCIVALGTRLGIQQTGFNWAEWGTGQVIQVELDGAELAKGHPRVDLPLQADANEVLRLVAASAPLDRSAWVSHCREVRALVPSSDPANAHAPGFCSPFDLMVELSDELRADDVMIPASSGSGQFVPMMVFRNHGAQRMLTNKGSASMGYGLAGAIGAALAAPGRRTFLVEGDGSFSQNLQELGTVAAQRLNLKMLLLDNDGYASIRTTQRNYFGGAYLGCDARTGLGFPDWAALAAAYGIPAAVVDDRGLASPGVRDALDAAGPALIIVKVDPDQTYYPKVTSRVAENGSMVSNPIHLMTPDLPDEVAAQVFEA